MASFPIFRDADTLTEMNTPSSVSSGPDPVFKMPQAKGLNGKEPRPRMLQNSGQKQPSSWSSGYGKPSLAQRHKLQDAVVEPHSDRSAVARSSGTSSKGLKSSQASAAASDLSNSVKLPKQSDACERRKKLLASIKELLDKHPEEFSHIPEMGREPDYFAEAGNWVYPEEKMWADFQATMERWPMGQQDDMNDEEYVNKLQVFLDS
ncbi:uncharacterized protein LOC129585725 [Paramacrobiotus metropolitanus]|uniref:uncharacterized protein LOC129585725 n=1 Tax=Paramacrobiotus metropolitanus TaxID=2943436 RepID=UPI0024457344|nr:uncharacterized protein LOC129585725 [Paramacrobiotus metropolitanus]